MTDTCRSWAATGPAASRRGKLASTSSLRASASSTSARRPAAAGRGHAGDRGAGRGVADPRQRTRSRAPARRRVAGDARAPRPLPGPRLVRPRGRGHERPAGVDCAAHAGVPARQRTVEPAGRAASDRAARTAGDGVRPVRRPEQHRHRHPRPAPRRVLGDHGVPAAGPAPHRAVRARRGPLGRAARTADPADGRSGRRLRRRHLLRRQGTAGPQPGGDPPSADDRDDGGPGRSRPGATGLRALPAPEPHQPGAARPHRDRWTAGAGLRRGQPGRADRALAPAPMSLAP